MARHDDILAFWFGAPEAPDCCQPREAWFKKNDAFDADIRERFLADYNAARDGRVRDWAGTAPGCLALILLLDQFPRNLFRGSGQAYATDQAALALAAHGVRQGFDQALRPVMHSFFYMPYMHSEDAADQRYCLAQMESLPEGPFFDANRGAARQHLSIIERFGRFPHRNAALKRESSAEELAFLEQSGSPF